MSDPDVADPEDRTSLAALTQAECFEMLVATPIGRVVFVDDGHPVALPVNYRWHEGAVVFRALDGTTLNHAVLDAPVSFEVDRWDERAHTGSSVVVKGSASKVTEWADKEQLETLNVVPWASDPWRQSWIRITPSQITGRRIS